MNQLFLCRFQKYEESGDGVNVSYTEAGESKQLRCKLLVGADGYFSAVRQQCLQDGPPDFAVSPLLSMQSAAHSACQDSQCHCADDRS